MSDPRLFPGDVGVRLGVTEDTVWVVGRSMPARKLRRLRTSRVNAVDEWVRGSSGVTKALAEGD